MPALDVQALAVADASLRLPFLFGRADLAGIDVKAHHASIDTILLVDLSPGAAAARDARLEVVDPVDRGDAAEPAVGLVVDVMPGELVHRAAPDDGLLAAVAEDHDEGVDRRRSVGVAEVDAAELAPVALGLGPGRGLDPPERADRGSAVAGPHELADRLVRAVVAVLGAEEFVEELDAGRPLLAQDLGLGLPPVGDGLGQAELLDARGLLSAIGGAVPGAAEVVARPPPRRRPGSGAVWRCDWPRCCKTSIVTICSLVSIAKVVPPSGPWMSRTSLEAPGVPVDGCPVRRSYWTPVRLVTIRVR